MLVRAYQLSFVWLVCLQAAAVAQPNYSWNGSSGSFADPNRWFFGVTTPAGPPATGDRALFLSGSGFTVSGNGSPAQVIVQVELATFTGVIAPQGNVTGFPSLTTGFEVGTSAVGRATFNGSGAALNSARPVSVGDGAEGTLILSNGASGTATAISTSASVSIAGNPAGIGAMILTTGSTFTSTGTFNVGGRGIGTLTVTADGMLNTNGILALNQAGLNIGGSTVGATGAQGTLNIFLGATVTNELQTNIGLYGKGTVNITDGTFTSTDGGTDNPAISIARFEGSEGHLNVSGTGHVISDGELIVGGGDEGTMTITDEGFVETFARVEVPAIVGFGSNAEGLVTVDGIDAQWTITDALVVGQLGTGEINITNGGTVFVEYTDFESDPYLYISEDAGSTGTVKVTNESSFLDASLITTKIGNDAFSDGRLEITDSGLASLARTAVGSAGEGTLLVSTDGSLITGTALIGELPNSMGTATLEPGGSWHVAGQLYVGAEGQGELIVGDTATLTVDEFISLGESPGSFGMMTIDGSTATIDGNLSAMYIGFLGEGELRLTNGASWTLNGDVTIAEIEGGVGAALVDATSSWNVTGGIYVGGSSVAAGGFGYLESTGSVSSETGVTIWEDSVAALVDGGEIAAPQVDINGILAGFGTVDATTTVNNGEITPDDGALTSTGQISFTGDYVQTAEGLLRIEIGGTTPITDFDVIEIGGSATLDGLLGVSFINDFVPVLEDEFEIIDIIGSISGSQFGLAEGTYVGSVGDLDVHISFLGDDGNDIVLYMLPGLVENADFDGDGDVDGRDFLIWQRGFGLEGQEDNSLGDANFDGVINAGDLAVWQDQYGTNPLIAEAVAVPEPSSILLLLLGASFNRLRRHRKC